MANADGKGSYALTGRGLLSAHRPHHGLDALRFFPSRLPHLAFVASAFASALQREGCSDFSWIGALSHNESEPPSQPAHSSVVRQNVGDD